RESRRVADRAADQVRADHQPAYREGAGHQHPAVTAGTRRRGDPVKRRDVVLALLALAAPTRAWPQALPRARRVGVISWSGNLMGLTWDHGFESSLKALELVKEALPRARRVALLWDATDSVHPVYARYFEKAASRVKFDLLSTPVRRLEDIEPAVASMRKARADALIVLPSGQLTVPKRREILALAMRERIPTLFAYIGRDAPDALLQFGPNLARMPRRAAAYVDR